MNRRVTPVFLVAVLPVALIACAAPAPSAETVLFHSPANDLHDIISVSMVLIDAVESTDRHSSLVVKNDRPTVVRLYEIDHLDVAAVRLTYRAMLRTEDLDGQAYLEMWVRVPGRGEFFSRALHQPLTGTTAWTSQETTFLLEEGDNADNVRLNLVIDGAGLVWIDDIYLLRAPL